MFACEMRTSPYPPFVIQAPFNHGVKAFAKNVRAAPADAGVRDAMDQQKQRRRLIEPCNSCLQRFCGRQVFKVISSKTSKPPWLPFVR